MKKREKVEDLRRKGRILKKRIDSVNKEEKKKKEEGNL